MQGRIKIILTKIQDGKDLTPDEKEVLGHWLEDPKHLTLLEEQTQLYALVNKALVQFDAEKAFDKAEKRLFRQPKVITMNTVLRVAAVITLVLGAGYLVYFQSTSVEAPVLLPENTISITLESGEVKEILTGQEFGLKDEKGETIAGIQGDTLNYSAEHKASELAYNTINIPNGQTFKMKLSDGTYVYLNAGSQLKYPVSFLNGERKVFLQGQAYFDVTHDEQSPFIVATENKDIVVYGTQFDVSAYPNDLENSTVLLEGSVGIRSKISDTRITMLRPDEMASWSDLNGEEVNIVAVDAKKYCSWIYGQLSIDDKPFKQVLSTLERKFNVRIINQYSRINEERFRGTFEGESLEEILEVFKRTINIDYSIDGNTVTIRKGTKTKN